VAAFGQAKQLLSQGVSRPDAFNRALAGNNPRNWSLDLASPAAQQYLHSARTPAEARRYFDWALGQHEQRVVEFLEVKYLSGL
jgi:hypothetical protein